MTKHNHCLDCGISVIGTGNQYMVHDHVWQAAGMGARDGMLCLSCLGDRLGRRLLRSDFTMAKINAINFDAIKRAVEGDER